MLPLLQGVVSEVMLHPVLVLAVVAVVTTPCHCHQAARSTLCAYPMYRAGVCAAHTGPEFCWVIESRPAHCDSSWHLACIKATPAEPI